MGGKYVKQNPNTFSSGWRWGGDYGLGSGLQSLQGGAKPAIAGFGGGGNAGAGGGVPVGQQDGPSARLKGAMENYLIRQMRGPRTQQFSPLFQQLAGPAANFNLGAALAGPMNQMAAMQSRNADRAVEAKAIKAPVAATAIRAAAMMNLLGGGPRRGPSNYENNIGQGIQYG